MKKICPKCGSTNIKANTAPLYEGSAPNHYCKKCGFVGIMVEQDHDNYIDPNLKKDLEAAKKSKKSS